MAFVSIAGCTLGPNANAQILSKDGIRQSPTIQQGSKAAHSTYILGPGDVLQIELQDLPELSGRFIIGPDGTIYLPRLRALNVEGLTIDELRKLLTQQFNTYVLDPQVYVRPVGFRPIRIYVGGEVTRPGYYTLTGVQSVVDDLTKPDESNEVKITSIASGSSSATLFPTIFDAIRTAQGITPYSDLTQVQVTRKRAQGQGGGRIRTKLNFLSLITEGNESQNIRLFDGDVVNVGKSNFVMREQLRKAGQSNLSPKFMKVFVTGRVKAPGGVTVPQGSSLNQAIALAGGPGLFRGKVEFVRFTQDGKINRRIFRYDPGAAIEDHNNPLLSAGDLIRVRESALSTTHNALDEITRPAVGIYSIFSLF